MKKRSAFVLTLLLMMVLSVVTVFAAPKLAAKKLMLKTGNVYVLRLKGNSAGKDVVWKTSSKKTVSIVSKSHNRAVLKVKKPGTVTISAKVGTKTRKCKITVRKNNAYPKTLKLRIGDEFRFSVSRKASWSLSNQRGELAVAPTRKKVTFTARKKGSCVLTAVTKKKTYTCRITIIRRDGATKADLKEEEAIRRGTQDETPVWGDQEETKQVPKSVRGLLTSLAYDAARLSLDTEYLYSCEVNAMDLVDSAQAFLLYEYLYKTGDARLTETGELRTAPKTIVKTILNELFGGALGSTAYSRFCSSYVEQETGDSLYWSSTGDFGDAGLCYFSMDDDYTFSNGKLTLTGRVMTYNENMNSYINTGSFRTSYFENGNGTFKFESVTVE